jgi:uncharacterized UPF0160 family protein
MIEQNAELLKNSLAELEKTRLFEIEYDTNNLINKVNEEYFKIIDEIDNDIIYYNDINDFLTAKRLDESKLTLRIEFDKKIEKDKAVLLGQLNKKYEELKISLVKYNAKEAHAERLAHLRNNDLKNIGNSIKLNSGEVFVRNPDGLLTDQEGLDR